MMPKEVTRPQEIMNFMPIKAIKYIPNNKWAWLLKISLEEAE